MKKILIPTLLASFLFAGEQNYIEFGGGYVKSKDNFSTENSKNISSLGSAKSNNDVAPYISFHYGQDLNENVNLYFGSATGDLYLGSFLETNYGMFDFGLKADLMGEEWKNPFLTGVKREKTDTNEYGVYLGYGIPINENFETMFRYEFSEKSYDKDDVVASLKREGKRHILSLENVYMTKLFNKNTALISNLSYEKYDADGKASSYNRYGLELGLSSEVIENVEFTLLGNYGTKKYEEINPTVNKKIDVDIFGINAGITRQKLFGYENLYTSLKAGYEKEEANHNFYDKESTYGVLSVGYKF